MSPRRAAKFRPESPVLEDYVVIPHVGRAAAEDSLTTGQLASSRRLIQFN